MSDSWVPARDGLSEPLYLSIATNLATDIANGRLRPGDRLPTQRELSASLGVSLGTVTRAYAEAEHRGLIRGETGRGTFVASIRGAADIPLVDLDNGVVDMSINLPMDWESPDLADALRNMATRGNLQRLLRYEPPAGSLRHRAAGARWMTHLGHDVDADRVLVCSGAQNAVTVALATVAEPGDVLLTDELTYPGIKAIASFLHLRLAGLKMDGEGLRADAFDQATRKRGVKALYCMPTIQNPTCAVMSAKRRRDIAAIARERGIAIIEDDACRPFVDDPPPTISSLVPERGYFVSSLSKVLSGGLRIAFVAGPVGSTDRIAQAIWADHWSIPPLMSEIATTWLEDGTVFDTLARKRNEVHLRQEMLREGLGRFVTTHPDSIHAWLRMPEGRDASAFTVEARRRGVAVSPGGAFAVDTPLGATGVRLSLGATASRIGFRRGLERLSELIERPGSFTTPMV